VSSSTPDKDPKPSIPSQSSGAIPAAGARPASQPVSNVGSLAGKTAATPAVVPAKAAPPPAKAAPPPPAKAVAVPPVLQRQTRRAGVSTAIALVAVVISLFSAVVAFVAILQASDARSRADDAIAAASARAAAPAPTTKAPLSTVGATPIGSASATAVSTADDFSPVYANEELRLQSAPCGFIGIDLDRPQVAAGDFELRFRGPCGGDNQSHLETLVVASVASSADVTPQECTDLIRRAPLGVSQVAVSKGLVLCLRTSADDAQRQGITQKMAVLEVETVADDGTTNVRVSAWNVPH
jgi:hypothetical protein